MTPPKETSHATKHTDEEDLAAVVDVEGTLTPATATDPDLEFLRAAIATATGREAWTQVYLGRPTEAHLATMTPQERRRLARLIQQQLQRAYPSLF